MFKFIMVALVSSLATFLMADVLKVQLRKLEPLAATVEVSVQPVTELTEIKSQITDLQKLAHAQFLLIEALKEQIDCMQVLHLLQLQKLEREMLKKLAPPT